MYTCVSYIKFESLKHLTECKEETLHIITVSIHYY